MREPGKCKIREMYLALCALLFGISLAGCQNIVEDTGTPSPFTEALAPTPIPLRKTSEATTDTTSVVTITPAKSSPTLESGVPTTSLETGEATLESTTMVPLTPTEPSPTPVPNLSTPTSDDAHQLTSMRTGEPWWSEDGRTLYFSTIGPNSQIWAIDIATNVIQPGPDIQFSYREAVSLTAALSPGKVLQDEISVSPSGSKILFPYNVASTGPPEETCDGEACWPIPAKEIGLIDVQDKQLTQLQMEGELIAMEVSFSWSNDENRVLIAAPPSWTTGSSTPAVWIADLPSERVYPMSSRDNLIYPLSISPNGDLVLYELERAELYTCDMYLWIVDSQKEELLPNLPCTAHFWLSDNRTIVFDEQVGHRIVFWAYDVTLFERREIAKSTQLPSTYCSYALAPDETSVAVVPCSVDVSGIWLVEFSLLGNN